MKRLGLFLAGGMLLLGNALHAGTTKVLLLGIDGATWAVLAPLMKEGKMPHLARLKQRGTHGVLNSFENSLSEIVWTTIATGKSPQKHGITKLLRNDTHRVCNSDRQVKSLWNILSERGRRVGVINYRATWPAEEVAGVMFPYESFIFQQHIQDRFTWPRSYFNESAPLRWNPTPMETDRYLKRFGVMDYDFDYRALPPKSADFKRHQLVDRQLRWVYRLDETATRLGESLLDKDSFDLFILYWRGVDTVSHGFWKHARPEGFSLSRKEQIRYGKILERYYQFMDEALGRILKQAGEQTTIFVVSDHGFQAAQHKDRAFSGDHHPEGVFVVAGPGIVRDSQPRQASVLDVTPTLLYLLGLPVGEDMDGRILEELFTRDFRRENSPQSIPSHETPGWSTPSSSGIPVKPLDKSWLKDLGYLR